MTAPAPLDPLSFPLHGSRLIEASAGTGKTFTIATLYVRLVLGHGGEAAFERALVPPQILVMTFTEAATLELRDRIRARLAQAARLFAAAPGQALDGIAAPDDPLRAIHAGYESARRPACARALQLAAEWMDEAAVFTIHGWCQRMLRDHAFDSASLFAQTLEPDLTELQAEAARDHWRMHFLPLSPGELRQWLDTTRLDTPDKLLAELRPLLDALDALPPGRAPAEALAGLQARLAAAKAPWTGWCAELRALLGKAYAAGEINKVKLKEASVEAWLPQIEAWAREPGLLLPELTEAAWRRLTPAGMAEATRAGGTLATHPAFAALEQLAAQAQGWAWRCRAEVLAHAAQGVAAQLAALLARRSSLGFQDLLAGLDKALRGPTGPALAQAIRTRHPVALVDEFQDTDPLQYRIFDTLWTVARTPREQALILIGDPKQAIYAFRGADLHTYLRARRDTAGRHATLGTNFRSTPAMVAAVNHVFTQAEARPGGGAFGLRAGDEDPVPFLPVAARGRAERWVVQGQGAPALQAWVDAQAGGGKEAAVQRMAQACASEITRLLRLGQQGEAGFAGAGEAWRALQAGDIAVLVNNGREAAAVRGALRLRGVRSVYLSEGQSVYRTPQAEELQRWLAACADPGDARALRAALATPSLGQSWEALERLQHDEAAWETQVARFRAYQACWRAQGVLPMLRRLMADFEVARRLLPEGERALTDLLHLAELLQHAATGLRGEHALLRHLAQARAEPAGRDEARTQRLEGDAGLVQVVTVHKSKGLEYPLVFLPFAWQVRAVKVDDLPLRWHDDAGRLQLTLAPDADAQRRADAERLGEDLRKLYVALTRARHATWIGIADAGDFERGALAALLGEAAQDDAAADRASLLDRVRAAWAGAPVEDGIRVDALPAPDTTRYRADDAQLELAPPRALHRAAHAPWWVASFSALRTEDAALADDRPMSLPEAAAASAAVGAASAAQQTFADSTEDATEAADAGAQEVVPTAVRDLHAFPRGPGPGTFLHGLLEWVAQRGFAAIDLRPGELEREVALRCARRGWSAWAPMLADWLLRLLRAPLALEGAPPLRLAALSRFQTEMEFWFAIEQADLRALDALVLRHSFDAAARPALVAGQLNGMLKGFMDLVFEHEGRWYVADYKSNRLGEGDTAYGADALRDALLAHRYDLQLTLYVFALHRLLRARLAGYDYEQHVGGALLLFLRGIDAPTQGLQLLRPPRALIDGLDALFRSEEVAP